MIYIATLLATSAELGMLKDWNIKKNYIFTL